MCQEEVEVFPYNVFGTKTSNFNNEIIDNMYSAFFVIVSKGVSTKFVYIEN